MRKDGGSVLRHSRRNLVASVVLIIAGVLSYQGYKYKASTSLLDTAWSETEKRYFDKSFNGYNWPAVLNTYRGLSVSKTTIPIDALAGSMLSLLESSHLQIIPNGPSVVGRGSKFMIIAPESRGMFGVSLAMGHPAKLPIVRAIASSSPLYRYNVRPGDRLLFYLDSGSPSVVGVAGLLIKPNGVEQTLNLKPLLALPDLRATLKLDGTRPLIVDGIGPRAVREIARIRAASSAPETKVTYRSLSLVTTLGRSNNPPTVIDVVPGSVSALAGVLPGAQVVQLDGSSHGRSVLRVKNPNGDLIVTRSAVRPDERVSDSRSPAINFVGRCKLLTFDVFDESTIRWLKQAITAGRQKPIILDLRLNRGGLATAMMTALSYFVAPGTTVGYARDRTGIRKLQTPSSKEPIIKDRVWILLGPASASAAEIVSSVLQRNRKATLVGEQSAGEVLEAITVPLTEAYSLQVPISEYINVAGEPIEGIGVQPDIIVAKPIPKSMITYDRTLKAASDNAKCGMISQSG